MTRRSCCIYATGIVCAHLLIVGIALVVAQVFQTMIHSRLKKEITLTEKSQVFESWKNPPPPVYMEYYFFNVTNPEEFLAGKKASVQQIGPYTYREYRPRENVTFLENGTKIYALNPKSFVFVPEKSAGDPEVDIITTVNIPYVAVMSELNSYNFFLRSMVSVYVSSLGIDIFMTRTVHEILWGFKDPLLTKIHKMKPDVDEYFGLMWKKNGTHEGEFVFHTGEQNYLDYGKIDTWNGQHSRKCSFLVFFLQCTTSSRTKFVVENLLPAFVLERSTAFTFQPFRCFFSISSNEQLVSHAHFVKSALLEGAPIVVSFPHFYQADPAYINAVDGLNPNKEEHETYLDLQPTTGVPIRACKRAQLNIILKRVPGFPKTRFINETIFPIMFVNETATIDDDSASQMRTLLLIVTLVSNFPLLIVGLGIILLLVLVVLFCRNRQKKNEVKRIDFTEAFHSFTTAKDDTAYTQVSDKPDDSSDKPASQPTKNGSYIAMSPVEAQKC
uniref:Scavenger receptor class B, member 2a n=1 Tax=Fundulus heteroclitus TaxID=8078 RepID=A0A3Q2ST58_FUNHE